MDELGLAWLEPMLRVQAACAKERELSGLVHGPQPEPIALVLLRLVKGDDGLVLAQGVELEPSRRVRVDNVVLCRVYQRRVVQREDFLSV